eukprot:TRINITY_DN31539_c0_g1_i1.p1 TRINITY_DN31539_c0_g1~~TRINITY_DN31539_c0_g1_i1.p1  ORF type:complete len:194 (+),score=22.69 TRINITY_DN31539_c0_g1_i1:103-684(+)
MTKPPSRQVVVVQAPTTYSAAQANPKRPSKPVASHPEPAAAAEGKSRSKKRGRAGESSEFRAAWVSVNDLGTAQFTGKQKKEHEAAKIVALGGQAPKAQKMPYKILMGMRNKAKEREAKRLQAEKESGVISGVSASTNNAKRRKRNFDSARGGGATASKRVDFGPAPGGGSKNGVMRVRVESGGSNAQQRRKR